MSTFHCWININFDNRSKKYIYICIYNILFLLVQVVQCVFFFLSFTCAVWNWLTYFCKTYITLTFVMKKNKTRSGFFWKIDLSVYAGGVDIMAMRTHGMWEAHDFTFDLILLHAPSGPAELIPYCNALQGAIHSTWPRWSQNQPRMEKIQQFVLTTMINRIALCSATGLY